MRSRFLLIFSTVALFVSAGSAQAQFKLGGHAGYDFDWEELFIGANAVVPIGLEIAEQTIDLGINGAYYLIGDGVTVLTFDGNLTYPIETGSSLSPYVGAGLVIVYSSFDSDVPDFDFDFDDFFSKSSGVTNVTDTDIGLSLTGGAEFATEGGITPFGEAFLYLKSGSQLGVRGGVRFAVGGS